MSYERCRSVEERAYLALIPFLREYTADGQWMKNDKGTFTVAWQKQLGDMFLQKNGRLVTVEVKAEEENKYGNFYLETWSNCQSDPRWRKRGWMQDLECNELWYYFLDGGSKEVSTPHGRLFVIDFDKLWKWFWVPPEHGGSGHQRHKDKPQWKTEQKNLTVGHCVPIDVVRREVGFLGEWLNFNGRFVPPPPASPPKAKPVRSPTPSLFESSPEPKFYFPDEAF